jgi:hypothetical protein
MEAHHTSCCPFCQEPIKKGGCRLVDLMDLNEDERLKIHQINEPMPQGLSATIKIQSGRVKPMTRAEAASLY